MYFGDQVFSALAQDSTELMDSILGTIETTARDRHFVWLMERLLDSSAIRITRHFVSRGLGTTLTSFCLLRHGKHPCFYFCDKDAPDMLITWIHALPHDLFVQTEMGESILLKVASLFEDTFLTARRVLEWAVACKRLVSLGLRVDETCEATGENALHMLARNPVANVITRELMDDDHAIQAILDTSMLEETPISNAFNSENDEIALEMCRRARLSLNSLVRPEYTLADLVVRTGRVALLQRILKDEGGDLYSCVSKQILGHTIYELVRNGSTDMISFLVDAGVSVGNRGAISLFTLWMKRRDLVKLAWFIFSLPIFIDLAAVYERRLTVQGRPVELGQWIATNAKLVRAIEQIHSARRVNLLSLVE